MCELAGTSRSTVTHLTSSMRRRDEKSAEQQFVEPFRHRRGRAVRQHRLRAQRDGDLEPLAQPLGHAVMLRAALVPLPVHAGGPAVVHLHAVGADVPHAGFRILREHQRQRDVFAAVFGPALQNRQRVERAVAIDDLLAGRVLHRLRHQVAQPVDHRQHLQRVHDAFGHLRRHQLVDLLREVVERLDAERQAHALVRAVHVRRRPACRTRSGSRTAAPARRAAILHALIGDRSDLEIRTDRVGDAREQLAFVEVGEKVVEV